MHLSIDGHLPCLHSGAEWTMLLYLLHRNFCKATVLYLLEYSHRSTILALFVIYMALLSFLQNFQIVFQNVHIILKV